MWRRFCHFWTNKEDQTKPLPSGEIWQTWTLGWFPIKILLSDDLTELPAVIDSGAARNSMDATIKKNVIFS